MSKFLKHSFIFFISIFLLFTFPFYTPQAKTYVTSGLVNKNWTCAQMSRGGYLTMDGQNVFCVEPHIIYKTNQKYEVISSRPSYISASKARTIGLISYYGTKYFQTERHYAASQSLIWIELGESVSSSTFKVDGIAVTPEMEEIKNMVNTHDLKPSFANQTFTLEVGKPLEIEDKNQVLERFIIESVAGVEIEKKENKLILKANSNAPKQATINVNNYTDSSDGSTIYYKIPGTSEGNGWQICGRFYVEDPVYSSFNLNIIHYEDPIIKNVQKSEEGFDEGKVTILKTDACTNQGLENTQITLQMDQEELLKNAITDKNGQITTSFKKHYQAQSDVISYITNFAKISPEQQKQYQNYFKSFDEASNYASKQAKERLNKMINDASYTFTAIESKPRKGYFQANNTVSLNTSDNDLQLHLKNERQELNIELTKIDIDTSQPIQEVIFELYAKDSIVHPDGKTGILYQKNDLVATFPKTDDNGKTQLSNLYIGEYYIKEVSKPTSYISNTNCIDLSYTTSNEKQIWAKQTITNKKTQIEIVKIDADTKKTIENAHLQLLNSSNEIVAQWISSTIPIKIEGLNVNETYTLIETQAPEGYLLASPITFVVEDSSKLQTIVMEDKYIYGKVLFEKTGEVFVDFTTGFEIQPIEGSELSIYNDSNCFVTTLKSNTSTTLPYGKYYAIETKAPEGYLIDSNKYSFEITDENQIIIAIENKLPTFSIDLTKQFEDALINFSDVTFGIYTNKDEFIASCPLDENGNLINVPKLPYGNYYLKELTTHPDYVLSSYVYPFTIAAYDQRTNHYVIHINEGMSIMNYLKRANLRIIKTDELNLPLKGATFILLDEQHQQIDEKTTNEKGEIIFDNLVLGTYYIQEKSAPDGYLLNEEIQEIKLEEDTKITITNQLLLTNETGDHHYIIPTTVAFFCSIGIFIFLTKKKKPKPFFLKFFSDVYNDC